MNESETRATLASLRSLEEHAMAMMGDASSILSGTQSANQIDMLRQDHERCSRELADLLRSMGGGPQSLPQGFEDLQREHSRLLHESGREDEVMEALLLTEEATAAHYGLAAAMELPDEAASVVKRHLSEEMRHVSELQKGVGTMPVEIAGGGVGVDHMFVDDRNPDDFDTETT